MSDTKVVRCAIYTRKSTEEGLEQVFNSLDAQRDACVAYIASQRHEGWVLSPELYDDGGFSGGNMNRPGLAQLMTEVQAGRIQVIVVYKVDRLTRSLADFAKIVDVLDTAGASFVSVTQSFNTTTSMGRLTLNVLLSFAQFEREVTGERIRDKIAASKRKGMWMGGPVPLGYDVQDRKLMVNDAEAATVRLIFERYIALGSVRALVDELAATGVRTKASLGKDGGRRGGIAFARGSVRHLLGNRVYLGETRHKRDHFPGEHAAIVPQALWDAVQALLSDNSADRKAPTNIKQPSLLIGLVFDGLARRMKPSHACKGSRRYRYYVTAPELVTAEQPAWTLPAQELETLVRRRLNDLLADSHALHDALVQQGADHSALDLMLNRAAALLEQIKLAGPGERLPLLERVTLWEDRVDIAVDLAGLFGDSVDAAAQGPGPIPLMVSIPAVRIRRGKDVRLVLANPNDKTDGLRDPSLIGLIARAHLAKRDVMAQPDLSTAAVAESQGMSQAYFTMLLRLSTLAPDIVTAILAGQQPVALTRQRLARMTNLPIAWDQQRAMLGFN
jgi:site-specific DNA recombinase